MSCGVFLLNKDGSLEEMNKRITVQRNTFRLSLRSIQTFLQENKLMKQIQENGSSYQENSLSPEMISLEEDGHWIIFFLTKKGFQHL